MSYVIYHATRKTRFMTPQGNQSFATERTAKGVLTKMVNAAILRREDWIVASYDDWRAADHEIEVRSVMGGIVKIKASDKGSRTSDPSMEGYFSM